MNEKDKIKGMVYSLNQSFNKFFKSIEDIKITITSAELLIPLYKKFKELKHAVGLY
jgi:hypothetical protein